MQFHGLYEVKSLLGFDDNVSILHINALSIINKFDEFDDVMSQFEHKMSYLCISETWPTPVMAKNVFPDEPMQKLRCKISAHRIGELFAIFALKNTLRKRQGRLFLYFTTEVD